MKRILFIYHVSSIGGGSYCLLNILKTINRTKYQPTVLLRKDGPLCDEIRKLNIKVYLLSSIRTVPYNTSIFKINSIRTVVSIFYSMGEYGRLLDNIKPDLVYINTMMMYPYLKAAKVRGIKTAIHIREHWPKNEHKIQRKIAVAKIQKEADQVIAINTYSATIVPQKSITIVYDWIDMNLRYKYMPLDTLLQEDCSSLKVYLYTGGLQVIKGLYEIVNTFSNHIVGDDKRLILMGVNTMPQDIGIKGRIKRFLSFLGYKSYSKKCFDIINADKRIKCMPGTYYIKHLMEQVYCMVSYFKIPHANLALAEGIIEGTVSLAASTEESIEYSYDGELAQLFEMNNQEDFKKKWLQIDDKYEELKEKIREKRYNIEFLFDTNRNAGILNDIYDKLLN